MNFLELAKKTVQQTGTIEGDLPTTVVGQTRRLKQIVDFVSEAYVDIQNAHRMWRWLQSEFFVYVVASDNVIEGSDLYDERTELPAFRFSQWGFKGDGSDIGLSIFLTSVGAAEEVPLRPLSWDRFYETQLRGVQTPNKPQFYSVRPDNALIISPTPDAAYTLRGKYRRSAQMLAADADIPEMPTDFHTVIKDAALQYVEGFDEGPRIPIVRLRLLPNWSMLEAHQLPKTTWGEPLA